MPESQLGIKRVCQSCDTRFYDMGRTPPVCPKCGTEVEVSQIPAMSASVIPLAPAVAPIAAKTKKISSTKDISMEDDEPVRLHAEDIPEIDDEDDDDASGLLNVPHHDSDDYDNGDDADDESILHDLGEETPERSLVETIEEAEKEE